MIEYKQHDFLQCREILQGRGFDNTKDVGRSLGELFVLVDAILHEDGDKRISRSLRSLRGLDEP